MLINSKKICAVLVFVLAVVSHSLLGSSLVELYSELAFPDQCLSLLPRAGIDFILPNEPCPGEITQHLELAGDDGFLLAVGTERTRADIVLHTGFKGLIGRDDYPQAKLFNDFVLLLIKMAPTGTAHEELRLSFCEKTRQRILTFVEEELVSLKEQQY